MALEGHSRVRGDMTANERLRRRYMLNMQDDSNRFDNRNDYDLGGEPDSWREWSQHPRTGEFSIAVSLSASRIAAPIGDPPRFEVSTDYLRNLAFTNSADADDGAEHGARAGRGVDRRRAARAVAPRAPCRYSRGSAKG